MQNLTIFKNKNFKEAKTTFTSPISHAESSNLTCSETKTNDRIIKIAVGKSRLSKIWKTHELSWRNFKKIVKTTKRTTETIAEFRKMSKQKQDSLKDVGGFVGGALKDSKRKNGHVISRSLITLDMDYAKPDIGEILELLYDWECCLYSTHKHSFESPRFRLVIPLLKEVSEEEYPIVAKMVAKSIRTDLFDSTTYEPARLMYWPSTSADAEFVFKEIKGEFLNPDEYLEEYVKFLNPDKYSEECHDWCDASSLQVSNSKSNSPNTIEKQIGLKQANLNELKNNSMTQNQINLPEAIKKQIGLKKTNFSQKNTIMQNQVNLPWAIEIGLKQANLNELKNNSIVQNQTDFHELTKNSITQNQANLPEAIKKQMSSKQANPLAKSGIVGAFCRVYPITKAIEAFLSDIYKPSEIRGRYDYINGQNYAGLIIYENVFAYSHHATDPASGKLLNAFDLVRVHKFGSLEEKALFKATCDFAEEKASLAKCEFTEEKASLATCEFTEEKASFKSMCEFAVKDDLVKKELALEQGRQAKTDFKNWKKDLELDKNGQIKTNFDKENDKFPFIMSNKNGCVYVNTPRLAQYFRDNNYFFLTKGQSGGIVFWVYLKGVYVRKSENEIEGILIKYISSYSSDLIKMKAITETYKILATDNNYLNLAELNDDEDIIAFENGLYHINAKNLTSHVPEYFGTVKLPAKWNYDAKNPEVFNKFLDELVGGDKEKQQFLKEFIGIALSNIKGFKTKKALFLLGEKDSGKSQLRAVVERILGIENCASIDLLTLEHRFGTGMIFGKRLVGSNDLGFTDIPELKIFKQLTGGDSILMENKFADGFTAIYNGVLWFSMNKLPNFGGDRGNAVLERIVIIECGNPCPIEKQDKQLVDKMFSEREAIIRDCVYAAAEVLKKGYRFTIPEASKIALAAYELELSPVKSFLESYCVVSLDSDDMLRASEVFDDYCKWCNSNGYKAVSIKKFICEAIEWVSKFAKLKMRDFVTRKTDANYYPLKWKAKYSDFM